MSRPASRSRELGLTLVAFAAGLLWVSLVRPGPLSLPWFWDEADVYVPGARWLAENGLDFRPGVFPDDWSRGHPPLLYLVSGALFLLFGAEPTVGHLLVLPFAALALGCTFLLGRQLWGWPAGLAAAALLATTPLFLSMANMLLPEMFLTGLAALALLLFARGRMVSAALVGSALVLIKETGVFIPAALTGAVLLDGLRSGALLQREAVRRAAMAAAPVGVLIAFFCWQKALAGYFVFPHHQNLLWERPFDAAAVLTVVPSMFGWHGRWLLVAGAAGLLFWRVAPAEERTPSPGWRPDRWTVGAALALLILGNAVFFAKMFWLERYALPAHPAALLLLAALLLPRGAAGARLAAGAGVAGAAATLGLLGLWSSPGPDEAELTFAYADVIATHRQAFEAIPEGAVVLTTWPMTEELRQPDLGFVEQAVEAVHARHLEGGDPTFDVALIAGLSTRAETMRTAAQARGLRHQASFQVGAAPQPLELWTR